MKLALMEDDKLTTTIYYGPIRKAQQITPHLDLLHLKQRDGDLTLFLCKTSEGQGKETGTGLVNIRHSSPQKPYTEKLAESPLPGCTLFKPNGLQVPIYFCLLPQSRQP